LLGRHPGVDGMKTGFICPSGFNVVASASRGGRHLVTVVLGSPSARERTLLAADLFERGFSSLPEGDGVAPALSSGRGLEDLPSSTRIGPPDLRPVICGGRRPPREDAEPVATGTLKGRAEPANQLPAAGIAFAGVGTNANWKKQALPPRAPLRPVLVWLGRDPPDATMTATDEREAARIRKVAQAKPAARPEITRRASPSKRVARAP